MKVVINSCFGGFSLSPKAIKRYLELLGRECHFYEHKDWTTRLFTKVEMPENKSFNMSHSFTKDFGDSFTDKEFVCGGPQSEEYKAIWDYLFSYDDIERNDPLLVQVIEELGKEANGSCAELTIIEIPDDVEYEIDEYDGNESIHEKHRSWC